MIISYFIIFIFCILAAFLVLSVIVGVISSFFIGVARLMLFCIISNFYSITYFLNAFAELVRIFLWYLQIGILSFMF
jgi:hypothetical protein